MMSNRSAFAGKDEMSASKEEDDDDDEDEEGCAVIIHCPKFGLCLLLS